MSTAPLRFRSRDGETMFAWMDGADPLDVMIELSWAWAQPDSQSICDIPACPTKQGSYCLECHSLAFDVTAQTRHLLTERRNTE